MIKIVAGFYFVLSILCLFKRFQDEHLAERISERAFYVLNIAFSFFVLFFLPHIFSLLLLKLLLVLSTLVIVAHGSDIPRRWFLRFLKPLFSVIEVLYQRLFRKIEREHGYQEESHQDFEGSRILSIKEEKPINDERYIQENPHDPLDKKRWRGDFSQEQNGEKNAY
jgi:hypothetical protein